MDEPTKQHLTPQEAVTFDTLIAMTQELGRAPSMRELATRMGLVRAGVQRHLKALKKKGAVRGPKWVGDWVPTLTGKKLRREA